MVLTLEEIKSHLRVIGSEEDSIIVQYAQAAEAHVEKYLGRDLHNEEPLKANVKQALLLLIAEFYENRESGFVGTIYTANPALDALLHFERDNLGL
jgi:uncharacterized phage protein (predicted DNA packaging)